MKQRICSLLFTVAISAAGVAAHAATPHRFDEQDRQEVKAVFLQQAAAATAHDIAAFERVFAPTPAGQPDPVTSGTSSESAKTALFLVYEVAVRTPGGMAHRGDRSGTSPVV
jgi:hypothetical protein